MKVEIKSKEKDQIRIEVSGESHTLTQLISANIWEQGKDAAAIKMHPFLLEPEIVVHGSSPEKILIKAAKKIEEQCDEFKAEFIKAMKK